MNISSDRIMHPRISKSVLYSLALYDDRQVVSLLLFVLSTIAVVFGSNTPAFMTYVAIFSGISSVIKVIISYKELKEKMWQDWYFEKVKDNL